MASQLILRSLSSSVSGSWGWNSNATSSGSPRNPPRKLSRTSARRAERRHNVRHRNTCKHCVRHVAEPRHSDGDTKDPRIAVLCRCCGNFGSGTFLPRRPQRSGARNHQTSRTLWVDSSARTAKAPPLTRWGFFIPFYVKMPRCHVIRTHPFSLSLM